MSDDEGKKVVWTPDGLVQLGGKRLERVELRPGVGEWLRQFADVAQALHLGIHCSRCGADVLGKNADSDRIYSDACGCREFVWPNRDYREPASTTH